jgi:hypothetical protein
MAAGHAISFVMFYGVQEISDKVGKETSFKWNGLEMGEGKSGADGREEDVTDK